VVEEKVRKAHHLAVLLSLLHPFVLCPGESPTQSGPWSPGVKGLVSDSDGPDRGVSTRGNSRGLNIIVLLWFWGSEVGRTNSEATDCLSEERVMGEEGSDGGRRRSG